jgi:hypothetical protein
MTTTTTKRETGLAPPLRSRPTAHCVTPTKMTRRRPSWASTPTPNGVPPPAPAQGPHGAHGAAYAPAAAAAAASIAGACGTGSAGAGAAVDAASDVDAEADHGAWRVAEDAVDTWSTGGTARNSVTVMSSLGRCMRAGRGGLVSACMAFASGGGSASAGIRSTNNKETRTTLGTDSARILHSWAGDGDGDGRRLAPTRACTGTGTGVHVRFGLLTTCPQRSRIPRLTDYALDCAQTYNDRGGGLRVRASSRVASIPRFHLWHIAG